MEKDSAQCTEQMFLAMNDKKSAEAIRHAFEQGGDHAVNEWLLKHDLDQDGKNYVSPVFLAFDYARLQRKQETLGWLDAAVRERSPWLIFLQKEPVFDFLHSDERYRAVVKKIGLPLAY
jgi:hypothetical protein